MKNILLIIVSFVALGAVLYWGIGVLISIQGVALSLHGKIAMGLGVFFTMLVGFGLMALLFYSNKHGHDEVVYHLSEKERDSDTL